MRMTFSPTKEIQRATTARITMPTARDRWPSATALRASPPVMQDTAAQPICWMVFRNAMSLFGHQPKLKRLTLICRRPVAAPKVAQYPVTAPPRIEAKIVIRMDCFKLSPNSQPKNLYSRGQFWSVVLVQIHESFLTQWRNSWCSLFHLPKAGPL